MKALAYIPTLMVALVVWLLIGGDGTAAVRPGVRPDPLPADPADPPDAQRRPVDLVICLDTSGSMTDLIDSARAKLWDVVNELAKAKPTPRLRVGLLTYGSPRLSTAQQGWVVRQTDLTTDLDTVYDKMMAMTTDGGEEFVGWVLHDGLTTMSWSTDPGALKLIFVAGNESADQAAHVHNFRSVAEQARGRGIVINAFYGGDTNNGMAEHWDQVASHGGGYYAAIDMRQGTIQLVTPQNDILRQLNEELNGTYLPYGAKGESGAANQQTQDANAGRMGAQSISSRTAAKATALYDNAIWDLVDASKRKDFDLEAVAEAELPEVMRSMSPAERTTHVKKVQASREAIQKKIGEVSARRDAYLKAERAKQSPGQTSLDEAMLQAIRSQASNRGFTFNISPAAADATKGTSSPGDAVDQR